MNPKTVPSTIVDNMQQNIGERLRRSGSSRCDEWLSGQRRAPLGLGGIMGTVTQAVGWAFESRPVGTQESRPNLICMFGWSIHSIHVAASGVSDVARFAGPSNSSIVHETRTAHHENKGRIFLSHNRDSVPTSGS